MTKAKRQVEIEELEDRFWRYIVEVDADSATAVLAPQALMVSGRGAMQFDHAGYREMLSDDGYRLKDYAFKNVDVLFPTDDIAVITYSADQRADVGGQEAKTTSVFSSTWVKMDGEWKCVAHTESAEPPSTG